MRADSSLAPMRLALAALGLVLVWRIIEVNGVLYDEAGHPRLDRVDSPAPGAPARAAERASLSRLVQDNPAQVAALLMLAREHEAAGDASGAAPFYRSALEVAPHDRDALRFATAHFLGRDDPYGVALLGRIAGGHPGDRAAAFAALRQLLASERHAAPIRALLDARPPWLGDFVLEACSQGVDPARLAAWLPASRDAQGIPAATACAIDRLRGADRTAEAYQLWLNTLPRERLSNVGFVYNGDFEHDPSGVGFDWILQQRAPREAGHAVELARTLGAAGRRALRVGYDARARQSGVPAQQFLALEPGRYELSGRARIESLKALRGVHWTVRCLDGGRAGAVIASSQRFIGSSEWHPFSMPLAVGPACRGQLLQLEPVAEGIAAFISGVAWFDDLRLRRLGG